MKLKIMQNESAIVKTWEYPDCERKRKIFVVLKVVYLLTEVNISFVYIHVEQQNDEFKFIC
jgi:hypothetical protein